MSFLHDVIRCFKARGMPQNNHYYNKKKEKKNFSNGKPELGILFEQPPPPHTHTHTDTHTNAHTLARIVISAWVKRSSSDYKINSVTPH